MAADIEETPDELFEIFRTTEDVSLIFSAFARLFYLATEHTQEDHAPPWAGPDEAPDRPWRFPYEPLRLLLSGNWKAKRLWQVLDARASAAAYAEAPCAGGRMEDRRALVVGAGPCGLRSAVELRLLGARVTVVESRLNFSRINQLHLWDWCVNDIKDLGGKCVEPPPTDFGANPDILHISIADLQTFLLKVALLLGVEVFFGTDFDKVVWKDDSWHACLGNERTSGTSLPSLHPPTELDDIGVLFVANGFDSKVGNSLGVDSLVKQSESAIGVVANFARIDGAAERRLRSFAMARQFYMPLFKQLEEETGMELENIVYTKGKVSNYFVMTPTKRSLVKAGVLPAAASPSHVSNKDVNQETLERLVRAVAGFPFKGRPSVLEALGKDAGGAPNVTFADRGPRLFDFSKTRRMEQGLKFVAPPNVARKDEDDEEDHEDLLLTAFVGDALIEPFWPEGLGIVRGFFAALDACSSVVLWSQGSTRIEVENHSVEAYVHLKTLAAATRSRVLHKAERSYGIMPDSRYRQFTRADLRCQSMPSFNRVSRDANRPTSFLSETVPSRVTCRSY